jgi:hypothetical protein
MNPNAVITIDGLNLVDVTKEDSNGDVRTLPNTSSKGYTLTVANEFATVEIELTDEQVESISRQLGAPL